ncbi:hypothetical protein VTO42DRAFT_2824 [Malbranchea cinnamomea]
MNPTESNPDTSTLRQQIQELQQRSQTPEQRAQATEQCFQALKFAEFLEACHLHISKPLRVETKPEFRTKGSITSPNGRICPTILEPWDFRATQQSLFDDVYQTFHPSSISSPRVFPSLPVIEDRGRQACLDALASEADLVAHQKYEVEIPVREIIEQLAQIPEACEKFALGQGIIFSNHTAGIMEEPGQLQPQQDDAPQPRADQNCAHVQVDGQRHLLYIIEYKAPHKLTNAYLRAGLRHMNMFEQVVQRLTIPTHPAEKLQYNAELLACAAVTQVYEYMMKAGLEYGVLTNGICKVMLWIPENDPATLRYCLLEPKRDAEPDEHGFRYPYTAVGCHVGLTLMALRRPRRSQEWRNKNIQKMRRWNVDFDMLIQQIPDEERKKRPPASEYRPPYYPINPRSPYLLRSHGPPSSPLQERKRKRKTDKGRQYVPAYFYARRPDRPPRTKYCTQKCLLGVIRRSSFDDACPNVEDHRRCSADQSHPIDRSQLISLMERQLNQDPDHGCRPLAGKEGLHGALFKLTLEPYGYTFVGKGTTYESNYEGKIYEHLKELQGSAVPVYLGEIYLREMVYYLRAFCAIIHMTLMAWGGDDLSIDTQDRAQQIARTRDEIRATGVIHLDERDLNMLWNPEVQRVQFIDFQRAKIISPGKQKRKLSGPGATHSKKGKREKVKGELC